MSAAAPRVAYVTLGCRTNRAETDVIAAELCRCGLEVADEAHAEVVVVNTCAVTGEAEAKARKAVRHAASFPQVRRVVATGCVAALNADALASLSPKVVVVADKAKVALAVLGMSDDGMRRRPAACDGNSDVPSCLSRRVQAHRGATTPTGRTRPGIKVQDGCDLRCTYCIVWKARGPARSVPMPEVLAAVRGQVDAGATEVVLTGINVGTYHDGVVGGLAGLLEAILAQTDVGRVRLSSIEPPDVTDELLGVMAASDGRVAPFLHVCLQSGSSETLAAMGRVYDAAAFARVVARSREAMPGVALGTDVIVGFPGESDAAFEESLAFCREQRFARMHVFRYSKRPGTPAASMQGQVPPSVSAERAMRMRMLAREMRLAAAAERVGGDELVLVQDVGRGVTGGLFSARVSAEIPAGTLARLHAHALDGTTLVCLPGRSDDA